MLRVAKRNFTNAENHKRRNFQTCAQLWVDKRSDDKAKQTKGRLTQCHQIKVLVDHSIDKSIESVQYYLKRNACSITYISKTIWVQMMSDMLKYFIFTFFFLFASAPAHISLAQEISEKAVFLKAQESLNALGYNLGKADGDWGKKSQAAWRAFLQDRSLVVSIKPDQYHFDLLEKATKNLTISLRKPGDLFQTKEIEKHCSGLRTRLKPAYISAKDYPPLSAFSDSISIGDSPQKDRVRNYSYLVLQTSALARAKQEPLVIEKAKQLLLTWGEAEAGLKTVKDLRYLGSGAGKKYRAQAAAPVLDVENAAQLGYTALYATEMLEPFLSDQEKSTLHNWSSSLIEAYSGLLAKDHLTGRSKGLWRAFSMTMPLIALAIEEGDEGDFERYTKHNLAFIDNHIDKRGAILKNANRGDRAIHYQSIGLIAIASLLDMMDNQGIEIPGYVQLKFHKAVAFFLDSDENNKVILRYAKQAYDNPGNGSKPLRYYRDGGEHAWWMLYYISRYPNHPSSDRLRAFISKYMGAKYETTILDSYWVPYPINCTHAISFNKTPKQ